MSFGLGGSQGTVRYALMVDDTQATQAITRFKSSVTSLAAPTNTITQNMGKLNQTFAAGVTPIKAQGNALTTLNANLKTTGTTTTGLGTKIKSTAGQFAGFATGLSATSSGVLQLAAGFRDYNDAQIAVDRVTRKNSLAQEALGKAQDKLKKITDTGVKSGKAYEAALLDVNQAQQMASIQSDLLGEAQERLFDSQTQFVASVVPTVLGAVGTLGFAFKELGGDKGIGGLIGRFKDLGGSIKGMGSSLSSFFGTIPGMVTAAGVGLGAALLIIDQINKAQDHMEQVGIRMAKTKFGGQIFSGPEMQKSLEQTNELFAATHRSALQLMFDAEETKKAWISAGGKIDTAGNIIWGSFNKSVEAGKKFIDLGPGFTATGADYVKWSTQMLDAGKSETDVMNFLLDSHIKRIDAIKIEDAAMVIHTKTLNEVNKVTKLLIPTTNELWKTWEIGGGKMAAIIAGFGAPIDTLKKKFLDLHNAMKPGTFTQGLLNYRQAFMDSFVNNPNAITKTVKDYKDLKTITDQTNVGAKALNQTWEVDAGKIAAQNTAKALEEARKKLEAFNKKVAEGVQAVGVTFKVKDNVEKFMKEIKKNLPNKIEKKIDMKLDFRGNVKDATTAFNSWLETATTMDEATADGIVKGIIKTIDEKFKGKKGAFAGLRAQLEDEMKNPNTVQILKNNLANGDYTAAGKGIFSSVSAGITAAANAGGGLANLWETGGKGGTGIVIPAPVTKDFDAGIKTVQTTATTAVTNITTSLAKVSSVNIPTPNESTYQKGLQLAINNAGQTVKIITSTLKKVSSIQVPSPSEKTYQKGLQLAINNAAQTVKFIKKELDKVGGIKVPAPKFNNFNSALDQAVSDAKRAVRDINNALTKVKKPSGGGSGDGKGPGATTGPFNSDSSKFNLEGSIMSIGSKANSGAGDIIIENHTHIGDKDFYRMVKAQQGKDRYRFGLG